MKKLLNTFFMSATLAMSVSVSSDALAGSSGYRDWYKGKGHDNFGRLNGWTQAHLRSVADVNGDGLDDIVGFGDDGAYVALSTGYSFAPKQKWSGFYGHDKDKWRMPHHPRFVVDLDNNGCNDIIGFGELNVRATYMMDSNGDGLCDKNGVRDGYEFFNFSNESASTAPKFVADFNGDGYPDLLNFSSTGVELARNLRNGRFEYVGTFQKFRSKNLKPGERSWNFKSRHLVLVGDIDNDGDADIVGFHEDGVYVALSNGDPVKPFTTMSTSPVIPQLAIAAGKWSLTKNVRILADMNNDGSQDIVGFANGVTVVSYANGRGRFGRYQVVSSSFGSNQGWADNSVRTVAMLNNDACPDLIGIGGKRGVVARLSDPEYCALNRVRFGPQIIMSSYYHKGWTNAKHVRLVADVNGDGLDDVVGFTDTPVRVSLNTEVTRQTMQSNGVKQGRTSRIMY